MSYKSISLICSIILIIFSSFTLNTFIRLNNARKTYENDDAFEDATYTSALYCKGGIGISIGMLVLGIILNIKILIDIYQNQLPSQN